MNTMKRQKDRTLKDELPRSIGAQYATGDQWRNNSRKNEEMEPKQNNTQLWMWLVIEARSHAVKSNIIYKPGILGPWIKANWKRSNRRRKWQPTPVFLHGESHGQRSLLSYSPRDRKELEMTEWIHFHFQTGDGKSKRQHFRNQQAKRDWNRWILLRWQLYLLLWARIP